MPSFPYYHTNDDSHSPNINCHLFTAPEILQNKKSTELSLVWNLGVIIDYVINGGKPFFRTLEEVKKFSGYYRSKYHYGGNSNDNIEQNDQE